MIKSIKSALTDWIRTNYWWLINISPTPSLRWNRLIQDIEWTLCWTNSISNELYILNSLLISKHSFWFQKCSFWFQSSWFQSIHYWTDPIPMWRLTSMLPTKLLYKVLKPFPRKDEETRLSIYKFYLMKTILNCWHDSSPSRPAPSGQWVQSILSEYQTRLEQLSTATPANALFEGWMEYIQ